jgi:hypothetical protein
VHAFPGGGGGGDLLFQRSEGFSVCRIGGVFGASRFERTMTMIMRRRSRSWRLGGPMQQL